MINILVYNHQTGNMEQYSRELFQDMPYITGGSLKVREFRGKSNSNIIWTSRRTMEAWNATRQAWGQPIYVGYAFRRIGEGGHANQSQHYAGTAFDVAQNLSSSARNQLRDTAASLNVWTYVEPAYLTPTWVHLDARTGVPACSAGYPLLRQGMTSVYVATLQDALSTAGIPAVGIDGVFGPGTHTGVVTFQSENGLVTDGVVGCNTWTALTAIANGYYRNNNILPPGYANE